MLIKQLRTTKVYPFPAKTFQPFEISRQWSVDPPGPLNILLSFSEKFDTFNCLESNYILLLQTESNLAGGIEHLIILGAGKRKRTRPSSLPPALRMKGPYTASCMIIATSRKVGHSRGLAVFISCPFGFDLWAAPRVIYERCRAGTSKHKWAEKCVRVS